MRWRWPGAEARSMASSSAVNRTAGHSEA